MNYFDRLSPDYQTMNTTVLVVALVVLAAAAAAAWYFLRGSKATPSPTPPAATSPPDTPPPDTPPPDTPPPATPPPPPARKTNPQPVPSTTTLSMADRRAATPPAAAAPAKSPPKPAAPPAKSPTKPAAAAPPAADGLPAGALRMRSLADFKTVQEPRVEGQGGQNIQNITDQGQGVVRFRLRIGKTWWDGDGAGGAKGGRQDRQRTECSQLGGPALQLPGQTWEYGTTFRTSVPFTTWNGALTAIMQLMPPRAQADPAVEYLPLVFCELLGGGQAQVLSILPGKGPRVVRSFKYVPGAWTSLRYRVLVHPAHGSLQVSVNGDAFKGETGVPMARGNGKGYGAKWGFYRHFSDPKKVCDDYVEHKGCYRVKLG